MRLFFYHKHIWEKCNFVQVSSCPDGDILRLQIVLVLLVTLTLRWRGSHGPSPLFKKSIEVVCSRYHLSHVCSGIVVKVILGNWAARYEAGWKCYHYRRRVKAYVILSGHVLSYETPMYLISSYNRYLYQPAVVWRTRKKSGFPKFITK